ncbi:hypothetical protein [Bacillus thuringiensis]|uniref:hypothetical protein n=1 Tax=Bacillus thuringiensis TaxID=1428 RepID=UPI0026E2E786|nr:hypothetical protein [Bacillus thuringiensis]MDO6634301.1 hypothetical protein [Bacillus thuringiensis]MDO6663539.1 hypothetical protein [Bacillus thuringiensis]MDO6704464.1 hypothetical protein [Bacillus thuringiensis]
MATSQLGNSLLKPESGWNRKHFQLDNVNTFFQGVRDKNKYPNANWFIVGDNRNPSSEGCWIAFSDPKNTNDDIFTFTFTGTAFRIMQKSSSAHRYNIKVRIDGGNWIKGSLIPNSPSMFRVCFEKLDLPSATHKVEVTYDGFITGSNDKDVYTFLSAIDYANFNAKVGDVLKEPEPGWKRFDDTDSNFQYSGAWGVTINPDKYGGSAHHCPSNDRLATVKFQFYGKGLRIISWLSPSYDMGQISIDNLPNENISYKGTIVQQQTLLYEKLDLNEGIHIVNLSGLNISFDAIDILAGELISFNPPKKQVSLYEKESGKIFVDNFDSVNPKWLMSPSNSFNNAIKKGFLRMNHSADKDVMLLIDKPQSNFAIQVIADYAPTKEGDEGGLLIYQNEKNKVEFLESYSANGSQSNKEWMAICKEDQWDFYTKTDAFFDYTDNDSLTAKRIGVVLKRGTAEGFVPLDINKIIMTTSNMLRLRQLYENYKVVLKDTADNILSTNIVAAAHTGIDILLPSLEFEGIIEIYDEENELLAKKQATFYGGDMYCMGSSLQIKMNSAELNTTDPTNLGYMVNNERIVKMTIVNDNIGAATNIKLSIQQYMEKVGYTWTLISLDGINYLNEIQIDSVAAQSTLDFWIKVVKDTNFLAFEPIYFNIHLKHN